jgi:hypothetical protein
LVAEEEDILTMVVAAQAVPVVVAVDGVMLQEELAHQVKVMLVELVQLLVRLQIERAEAAVQALLELLGHHLVMVVLGIHHQ